MTLNRRDFLKRLGGVAFVAPVVGKLDVEGAPNVKAKDNPYEAVVVWNPEPTWDALGTGQIMRCGNFDCQRFVTQDDTCDIPTCAIFGAGTIGPSSGPVINTEHVAVWEGNSWKLLNGDKITIEMKGTPGVFTGTLKTNG